MPSSYTPVSSEFAISLLFIALYIKLKFLSAEIMAHFVAEDEHQEKLFALLHTVPPVKCIVLCLSYFQKSASQKSH